MGHEMALNRHDELLLRDLKFQPIWLMILYILLGILSFTAGSLVQTSISNWLCGGGGFLVALGAEKLVSRRIRFAAKKLIDET